MSRQMTRKEAIQIAKLLAGEDKKLSVVFDKQLKDYFISENDWSFHHSDFYQESNYKLIGIFK